MRAKENYNRLINMIERRAFSDHPDTKESIALQVERESGFSARDISTVFQYMTGQTLYQYIAYRKMAAAFQKLCENEDYFAAVEIAGLGDQSCFIKKFKGYCMLTPKQALEKNERKLFSPPQTWEEISSANDEIKPCETSDAKKEQRMVFGIEADKVVKISEAIDLRAVYGFNDIQANAAFMLSEKYELPLEETFAFIDDFSLVFASDENGEFEVDEEEFNKLLKNRFNIIYVCFNLNLSIWQAIDLINELKRLGADVEKMDYRALYAYENTSFSLAEINELLRTFDSLAKENERYFLWEDFVRSVQFGNSPEEAYSIVSMDSSELEEIANAEIAKMNSSEWEVEEAEDKWIEAETDYDNPSYEYREIDIDNYNYYYYEND